MKYIQCQLFTAMGAALCVFALPIIADISTSDSTAIVSLVLVPVIVTGVIAFRCQYQAVTLPLYSIALYLVLSISEIYPYYSPDPEGGLPTHIYAVYVLLSSIPTACATAVILASRKKQRMPNQAL